MEGWTRALLCNVCLSHHPLSEGYLQQQLLKDLRDEEWMSLAEFIPCCWVNWVYSMAAPAKHQRCPSPGALCCCIPLEGGQEGWPVWQRGGEAQLPREVSKLLPLAAPRSWTSPGSCGWCSQTITHFSLDCPAGSCTFRMNYARNAVKHQKCWGLRRVLPGYELICG